MTDKDWYRLCQAVAAREYQVAQDLLAMQPALRNARNRVGETVLHYLAIENDLDAVVWLHAKGFSLDDSNGFGTPIVFEVAQLGYRDLFEWFLQYGANVFARDTEGNGILEHLFEFEQQEMAECVTGRLRNYGSEMSGPA